MTHLAAVGRAERPQPRAPSLVSVPLTCRCSRAPHPGGSWRVGWAWTPAFTGKKGWRPTGVLVVRLGAHLARLRPDGAPVPGRSPGQAALTALEAHEPSAAGGPLPSGSRGPGCVWPLPPGTRHSRDWPERAACAGARGSLLSTRPSTAPRNVAPFMDSDTQDLQQPGAQDGGG